MDVCENRVAFTSKYSSCAHIKYHCRQWRETQNGKMRYLRNVIFRIFCESVRCECVSGTNNEKFAKDRARSTSPYYHELSTGGREKNQPSSPHVDLANQLASVIMKNTADGEISVAHRGIWARVAFTAVASRINCPGDSRKRGNFYVAVAIVDCHGTGAARARTDGQVPDRGGGWQAGEERF